MRFQENDSLCDETVEPWGPLFADGEDDDGQDHASEDDPELTPRRAGASHRR